MPAITSRVKPSLKWSCSGAASRFTNGRTVKAGLAGSGSRGSSGKIIDRKLGLLY